MTSRSARHAISACVVSAAALAALMAPVTASAVTKPKRLVQCAGAGITMDGSTFQNVAEEQWETSSTNPLAFNSEAAANTSKLACQGIEIKNSKGETTKTTGKPTVNYEQSETSKGSGACMHNFGANTNNTGIPTTNIYTICGTDEAPNATQKEEIEKNAKGYVKGVTPPSLETIPVTQGSESIIIHLPAGCKAKSEVEVKDKKFLLGRLVLDQQSVLDAYQGETETGEEVRTWGQLLHTVTAGNDKLEGCTPETVAEAENTNFRPVVREDSSGTTHIFKAFLQQVNPERKVKMEEFPEVVGGKSTGCGKKLEAGEEEFWFEVAEGCQNQRWPEKADVLRPTESGNPGVIDEVAATPSSLGYADDAAAREYEFFSKKGYKRENKLTKVVQEGSGGENKKGTATTVGEQNNMFWAELNDRHIAGKPDEEFTDPTSTGDTEKLGTANCKKTDYIESAEHAFPPATTLDSWSEAKAALNEEHYSICGLTYILAYKQYAPYLEELGFDEAEEIGKVTTAENYLNYVVNTGAGGKALKDHDYEALPTTPENVAKKAETGLKEVEW